MTASEQRLVPRLILVVGDLTAMCFSHGWPELAIVAVVRELQEILVLSGFLAFCSRSGWFISTQLYHYLQKSKTVGLHLSTY